MYRFTASLLAVALVLTLGATAEAGKKKKKNALPENTMVARITAVSEDGKTVTVTRMGVKKKNAVPTELKVSDKTQVQYIGIPDKSEQKLTIGYVVLVALDEQDRTTATAIAATKSPAPGKKNKKNQTNQ